MCLRRDVGVGNGVWCGSGGWTCVCKEGDEGCPELGMLEGCKEEHSEQCNSRKRTVVVVVCIYALYIT